MRYCETQTDSYKLTKSTMASCFFLHTRNLLSASPSPSIIVFIAKTFQIQRHIPHLHRHITLTTRKHNQHVHQTHHRLPPLPSRESCHFSKSGDVLAGRP